MPPAEDLAHLLTGGPQVMGDAVADYEHHLFTGGMSLAAPLLVLMVLDPDHPHAPLKPVMVPYATDDLQRLGGDVGRGRFGKFIANLALGLHRLPPQIVRDASPFHSEGQQLLYTAFATESVLVQGDDFGRPHIRDFEQDVPLEYQHHIRSLYACDGKGFLYVVTRPDGPAGPPQLEVFACRADPSKPGRYLGDADSGGPRIGGLVPWGLDTLASGYRRVFEGVKPPCSDRKSRAQNRKSKGHSRKKRGLS